PYTTLFRSARRSWRAPTPPIARTCLEHGHGITQACARRFPGPQQAAAKPVTTPPQCIKNAGNETEGSNSMLALKYLLMILGVGLFGSAGALVAYDVFLATQLRRLLGGRGGGDAAAEVGPLAGRLFRPARARLALQLAAAGALAILDRKSTRLNSSHVSI